MAKKHSAGILLYRRKGQQIEVLLGHPGGPFWAKKDKGSWSVPKGEVENGSTEIFATACREFQEEIGQPPPSGEPFELGDIEQRNGKVVTAWAIEGDLDVSTVESNTFEMEWPPRSGNRQTFPEIDRAEWFSLEAAAEKLNSGQVEFLHRLSEHLQVSFVRPPEQGSLF